MIYLDNRFSGVRDGKAFEKDVGGMEWDYLEQILLAILLRYISLKEGCNKTGDYQSAKPSIKN